MSALTIKWRGGVAQLHGTINGVRYRQSLGTRDKEVAARKAAEIEARVRRIEVYGPDNEYTFADAALKYLEANGESRYLPPLIKALGAQRLGDIKPGHVRDLALKLKPAAKAATRNRHVIVPVRSVINFAADRGMCQAIKVRSFDEAAVKKVAIDRQWLDKFREHATHHRLATLALFNFVTAARIGEAVQLTPEHFDLDAKTAWLSGDNRKTGESRTYYLTDELVRELRLIVPRKVRDGRTLMFGYSSANACIWAWKDTCRRAGIEYVTRHEAGRHSAATEMIVRNKVDAVTAAALGGWGDPKVLLKRYAHAEQLNAVAESVFGTNVTQPQSPRLKVVRKA